MPSAEIITIGTEILLGEIIDTNARYLARHLREHGIDIFRTTSIGDNAGRIAAAIREAMDRAEIVITTGGLGPTVDDPTREAAAMALGVQTEFHPELWEQVKERFARFDAVPLENNRRQAYIPAGGIAIENPVGTAPAFRLEAGESVLICLPGVPREMEHLLDQAVIPYLQARYDLQERLWVRVLHTAGVGESQIDNRISDLEQLANPTVGLAAHAGQVDVRIVAKAPDAKQAGRMIAEVESQVRERLGDWIYGADAESLEQMAVSRTLGRGWRLAVLEAGLEGKLVRRFAGLPDGFVRGEVHPQPPADRDRWAALTASFARDQDAEVCLAAALYPDPCEVHLALFTPEQEKALRVPIGGPPQLAPRRAINVSLNLLLKIPRGDQAHRATRR